MGHHGGGDGRDPAKFGGIGVKRGAKLNFIWEANPKFHASRIVFRRIGKKSNAHLRAISVHRGEIKPEAVARTEELLRLIQRRK